MKIIIADLEKIKYAIECQSKNGTNGWTPDFLRGYSAAISDAKVNLKELSESSSSVSIDEQKVYEVSDVFEQYQKESYKGAKFEFHSFAEYLIRTDHKLIKSTTIQDNEAPRI